MIKNKFLMMIVVFSLACLSGVAKAQNSGELQELPAKTKEEERLLAEARYLNEAAAELYQQGKYQKLLEYLKPSLAIYEKILGREHKNTASSYHNIGMTYHKLGEYEQAHKYLLIALEVRQKVLGEEHSETAYSYDGIGEVYQDQSLYSQAIELSQRALQIREKVFSREHILTARSYNNVATAYHKQGNYKKAIEYYQHALAIWETVVSGDDPNIAATYSNIGMLHRAAGRYPSALDFLERALNIREQVLGEKHLDTALNYNNIGTVYSDQGGYVNALIHFQYALRIQEDSLGNNHPLVAQSCNNIGSIYVAQANYPQALAYYQRALSIQRKALGEVHQATAVSYSNIGDLYYQQRNYQQADKYFQKSLKIMEHLFGQKSPITSTVYNNIATVYHGQGKYQLSLEYSRRTLEIREKELGPEHPDTAISYNSVGGAYDAKGNYSEAIKYYQRSLEINTQVLGKQHPETVNVSNNISRAYAKLGDYPRAYKFARQSFNAFLLNRQKNFSFLGSTAQKESYQSANTFKGEVLFQVAKEYMVSLDHEGKLNQSRDLMGLTFNDWLNYKGSIMDSENRLLTFAKNTRDITVKGDYLELIQLRKQYSRQSIHRPETKERREFWQQELDELSERISVLTTRISLKDPRLQQEMVLDDIDPRKIAAKLPKEALYLDYARMGDDSYIVFTLDSTGQGQASFLGDENSAKLKNAVSRLRAQNKAIIGDREVPQEDYSKRKAKKIMGELWELVLPKNIRDQMANKQQLVISPDGVLRLLPFEALYNQTTGRYLVQDKRIQYIASGRELLRVMQRTTSEQRATESKAKTASLFSDPNFGMENAASVEVDNKKFKDTTAFVSPDDTEEEIFMKWKRLPGTAEEAEAITELLKGIEIKPYSRDNANERNLLRTRNTDILHIATHGFFNATSPDPMLQSGLLLAGANHSFLNKKDTGIVSALKLSGLDLTGTSLVVLSACETGTVDSDATEGVSGLMKAFIQAGADKVVMSLWEVSDGETATLMKRFYQYSRTRASAYSEALRQSKITMINEDKHPYYWAAFLLNGW